MTRYRGFLFTALLMLASCGRTAVLVWDANPETFVTGYRVYHGFASGHYTDVRDAGNWTMVEVQPSPCAVSHFFAVTAYTADGLESAYSDELEWVPACPRPDPPGGLRILSRTNFVTLDWSPDLQTWETIGTFQSATNEKSFFRLKKL